MRKPYSAHYDRRITRQYTALSIACHVSSLAATRRLSTGQSWRQEPWQPVEKTQPGYGRLSPSPAARLYQRLLAVAVTIPCISLTHIVSVCILHIMTSVEIIRKLTQDGWVLKNTKGSHHQFTHVRKSGRVTVKHPSKDIPIGTLRNIYRQAKWQWEDR